VNVAPGGLVNVAPGGLVNAAPGGLQAGGVAYGEGPQVRLVS
jgi:hypothetical protein